MSNKQTAVEWLENELSKLYYDTQFKTFEEFRSKEVILWEQAKQLELEEIEEAYNTTYGFIDGKEYYEKTFK